VTPRYELGELLGRGGLGEVYAAIDRQSGRKVALKRLRVADPTERRQLEHEARTLGGLRHEGIVRLLDVTATAEESFFTMEHVAGLPLSVWLERKEPLEPQGLTQGEIRWLLLVASQIFDILDYVHHRQLLHRDLKPSNVMVLPPPGAQPFVDFDAALRCDSPRVKLLDFGLALTLETVRREAFASGTPLYMAPEQLERRVSTDARSDLYSAGALLYHTLTRQPPYTRLADALSPRQRPASARELNPSCPEELEQLLESLLEQEPHRRPNTAGEARDACLRILRGEAGAIGVTPRLRAPAFVGREAELTLLRQALREAATGKGCCLRVTGGHGAGKTWLLEESGILSEALADMGMVYVRASCAPQLSGPAIGDDRAGESVGLTHQGLPGLLNELAALHAGYAPESETLQEAAPPSTRELLVQQALRVVSDAVAETPVLLVLDDLHHADDFTVEVLNELSRTAAERPLAIIVSYRREAIREHRALERWLDHLEAQGHPTPIQVGTLTDSELQLLAERMLSPTGQLAGDLETFLLERSKGQPLALARWLQSLWERNSLLWEDPLWKLVGLAAAGDSPWEDRISRLAENEARVLTAALLLDSPIEVEPIREVLGSDASHLAEGPPAPQQIEAILNSLVERSFLSRTPEGLTAPPDLKPSLLFPRLAEQEIKAWCERAAAVLLAWFHSSDGPHTNRAALLLEQAGQEQRAATLHLRAARDAQRHHANHVAIQAFQRCLDLESSAATECDAAEDLGALFAHLGRYDEAHASFDRAWNVLETDESRTDAEAIRVRLLDRKGRVLSRQGNLDAALSILEKALPRSDDFPDLRARVLLHLGGVHLQRGEVSLASDHFESSRELYQTLNDPARLTEVESNLGNLHKQDGKPDQAIEHFGRALALAEKSGDLPRIAITLVNLGNLHRARGDDQKALEYVTRSLDTRERIGDRLGMAICRTNLARIHSYRGELQRARESTEVSLRLFEEIGDPRGVLLARCNLAAWLIPLGKFSQARSLLDANLELARKQEVVGAEANTLWNLALLAVDVGDLDAANSYVEKGLRLVSSTKPSEIRANMLETLAYVAVREGRFERGQDAIQEALDLIAELGSRECLGTFLRTQIRLHVARGDPEEALRIAKPYISGAGREMEKLSAALFHRELGRVYRELGPDWADRTEKYFQLSLDSFRLMESPQNVAETLAELAVYWQLLEEEDEARKLFKTASASLEELGATARVSEIRSLGSAS